jgi:outer membrane protein assembly factor BamE
MYKFLIVVLLSILVSGCGIVDPWVYKINKQQGNITEQKKVDKLEIGMTKEQVRFVMGTPMAMDSFDANRWDYMYTYKPGHGDFTSNNLTLYFVDNKLSKIEGEPLMGKKKEDESAEDSD